MKQFFSDGFFTRKEESFSDLCGDDRLKNKFEASTLSGFWLHCQSDFPKISTRATKLFLPFRTSYLCKCGFSAALAIKSKYRSRLELELNLRLNLTKNHHSNIDELVAQKQAYPSHCIRNENDNSINCHFSFYVGARIVVNTLCECYYRLVEFFFVSIFNFYAEVVR